jgi:catechol 2,3-dioxygenase-like lactoylglutathione lyase family enzyme
MAATRLVARINVVFFYVRDLERSLAFYRDLLGIPLEKDASGNWAEATFPDGIRFALHAAPDGELESGSVRVDFEVADIDEAAERLRAERIEVSEIEREFWGSACEVVDRDGYRIHLFQPAA